MSSSRLVQPYYQVIATGVLGVVAVAAGIVYMIRKRQQHDEEDERIALNHEHTDSEYGTTIQNNNIPPRRRCSFTSVGLALGTFPERVKAPATIINAACYFKDCPSKQEVANQVVEPLLVYERFSQILDTTTTHTFRPSSNKPHCTAIDLVREFVIDGDTNATHRTIFEHSQDDLINGRNDLPWWEILIVRNTSPGSSSLSACVVRVHHALADGLALIGVFKNVMTTKDGSTLNLLTDKLHPPKLNTTNQNILATIWSLVKATFEFLTLGMTRYDDDTAFSKHNSHNGSTALAYSGKRDFVLFPDLPLSFIKAIKKAAGVTVNDVLMAAVSQAIYEYCMKQQGGDAIFAEKGTELQCRALFPVGFPRSPQELSDPATALRNKWCLVSCDAALGCDNVVDRLRQIHENTTQLKEKPVAYVTLKIQNILPKILPHSISRQSVADVFSRHSLVLTNVPGPGQRCQLAGKTIENVQLFFENMLPQVDLISYADTVYGNIIYDPTEIPNLKQQGFGRSYALALLDLAKEFNIEAPSNLVDLR